MTLPNTLVAKAALIAMEQNMRNACDEDRSKTNDAGTLASINAEQTRYIKSLRTDYVLVDTLRDSYLVQNKSLRNIVIGINSLISVGVIDADMFKERAKKLIEAYDCNGGVYGET